MESKDILSKLEALEKRIQELESQKKGNLSMFGRSYSQIGNSDSDFLIKTKGQVKVQWGSKFIDLIKDGKINVDANFIFTAKSADKLGVKDGLYVTPDGSVYLKLGDITLNLVGEVGTTYVSFLEEQETSSEQKYTALHNIGFLYKDMNSLSNLSLKNGIIYIEAEEKLYIVKDGVLSEFTIAFPNPFTEQFIIAKSDSNKGALLIRGQGVSNSIAFEKLFIYNEFGNSYIDSDGDIYFRVGSDDKLIISNDGVTFVDPAISSMFKSSGATETSGFRLYFKNNESTLEVDNLIVRNSSLNVDIDLTIREDEENIDIEKYFSKPEIQQLLQDQEVGTTVAYLGQFGVITIAKSERDYTFSAIVRAITDGQKWSHRSINGTYDSLTGTWYGTSTYIIQDQFNPGYYWAMKVNSGKPDSPEYIGTTDQGFTVTEDKPYLLYTNDGRTWNIVSKYIPPVADRIYIISTGRSASTDTTTGKITTWPSGFLGYAKNETTIVTKLGKSNYIPTQNLINTLPTVELLKTLTIEADSGYIPQKSGYFYLWSIQENLDKTVLSNWVPEFSGTLPIILEYKQTSDWGNSSLRPGYQIWEVDENDTIIGKPSSDKFVEGTGTESNWTNQVWRKSFLETIMGETLTANNHNYDSVFGWRFNYSGILKSTGYAGYWTSRISGLQDPTSDDENDINFVPTAKLDNLYGEVMDNGELIQFQFTDVRIGKLLPYRYSLGGYSIGDKIPKGNINLYEVSYKLCYYKRVTDYQKFDS